MRKEIKEMREKNPEEYMIKKKTEMLQVKNITINIDVSNNRNR